MGKRSRKKNKSAATFPRHLGSTGAPLLHPPPATAGPDLVPPPVMAPAPVMVPPPVMAPAPVMVPPPVMAPAPVMEDGFPAENNAELLPQGWRAELTEDEQKWIGQVLFTRDSTGTSQLVSELDLWWTPPPFLHLQPPASPDLFFPRRLFLWMPCRIWGIRLTCPQPHCAGSLTEAGLYRTIRRVLELNGWYLMATEYLECPVCKKTVAGWSQAIIRQLPPGYSYQFPAVLTYKLSCDWVVFKLLHYSTPGENASWLAGMLKEQHTEAWMRRSIQYLGVCERFLAVGTARRQFSPPPPMPPVPSPARLLTVYCYEVLSRLDECKAAITSTFGSVLRLDSTEKMKLAGTASKTAAWITNVCNEHGQVLMSVLTADESVEALSPMAAGLMRRYRDAEVPPPQLLYVDRDCCCLQGGVSATAALFPDWDQLAVRRDTWHVMRSFAAAVTAESHALYPAFLRQLSDCIFEVDSEDARRLTEATRSELAEGRHGTRHGTEADVKTRISPEEWSRHCRHRTRGAAETERLIQELLDTFGGAEGRDTLGFPLLDPLRVRDVWSTQRRHLRCIQDPPGVQLYTETGRLTKGGVSLPVFRCARRSTVESFHRHLDRFVPGMRANDLHFQAFLVDALVKWNVDRAAEAAPPAAEEPELPSSYNTRLTHVVKLLSQEMYGLPLDKDIPKLAAYTGELIGIEYLYRQTGRGQLQEVSLDPDIPDETADETAAALELDLVEKCIEEDDPTFFCPIGDDEYAMMISRPAAVQSGDPGDAPRSGLPTPPAPDTPPEAPKDSAAQLSSSDSEVITMDS